MEVTTQPGPFAPSDFQTGLFECCDDCGTCAYGYFCLPCLGCTIASNMGECCLCGLGWPIRSVYRTKYNIKGSMSEERHRQEEAAEDLLNLMRIFTRLKIKPSCDFPHFVFFINTILA
ncbi:hypothetical protein PDJAM_G00087090 [Pangasius djambal]|uniref:Uncharacterized protein n=1 Tax=Pangasius djambal TaxID=1691987 RepID=A0ACC5Z514_9TELE|nr:hypothetical protein [Pangasius djambal]